MSTKYGERWAQGIVLQWLNQIIKDQKLPFRRADQEVQIKTCYGLVRYPDIIIWDGSEDRAACLIELKQPVISAYAEQLVNDALNKAIDAGIPFFATWNLNKFVLWETFRPGTTLLERRLLHKDVLDIKDLKDLTRSDVEKRVKNFLAEFLKTLLAYYETKIVQPKPLEVYVLPKLAPDEILVYYLKTAVDSLYIPVSNEIMRRKEKEPEFLNKLAQWFVGQGWLFEDSEDDYDRVSRQAVYLLINKVLFYNILKEKFGLETIRLEHIRKGDQLKEELQKYFNFGIDLNPRYGIIFATDFLENIPIPNEMVDEIVRLINELNKYNFAEIGYDIVGKIFEKLIPPTERHKLGQYFTSTDIVDLILGFTIKHPDDKILDPACGSGTFLVRAYHRKKYLAEKFFKEGKYPKPTKPHAEILKEIWGIDVAKFPAHLSLINLMREKIESVEIVPNVACRDFFDVSPGKRSLIYELAFHVPKIRKKELEAEFPKECKACVTNPPYTRQEELEDIFLGGYKDRLRELIKGMHRIDISKRSSIYAYFFLHGAGFLDKSGRMGLITSNSWLDVDFGKNLQEFFLKNFKIVAIIESKVERWFEDADINTAITILEKCDDERSRDSHLVKFVYLKKKLRELLPVVESEEERWKTVEKLVDFIENCDKNKEFKDRLKKIEFLDKTLTIYEDENLRILMISQADLWAEGWNEEENKYDGSKWGKYIRAPEIFFKILEKGKDLLVPLKKIAEVRFGIKTGANEFFYLTQEKINELKIEKEFWMHPIKYDEWLKIKDFIPKEDIWTDKDGKYFKQSQYAKSYKLEDIFIDGNVIWVPNYVIKSPRECKSMVVDPKDLKYRVLLVHKDKKELKRTNILKYIEWGEEQKYHKRPTCESREKWYELYKVEADILSKRFIDKNFSFTINPSKVAVGDTFFCIHLKDPSYMEVIAGIFNSTLYSLMVEIYGRTVMGQGVLLLYGPEIGPMPIFDPSKLTQEQINKIKECFKTILKRNTATIFEELKAKNSSEISINRITLDRRELDRHIIEGILGLTEKEQLEVYKAVIDLVKARIERAKTVSRKRKKKEVDVEALANSIITRLNAKIEKFPDAYLSGYKGLWLKEIKIPAGQLTFRSDINGFYVQVSDEVIYRGWNQDEAKFVYYAALTGSTTVKLPMDKHTIKLAIKSFENEYKKLREEVNDLLSSLVFDTKIRKNVEDKVWKQIFSKVR